MGKTTSAWKLLAALEDPPGRNLSSLTDNHPVLGVMLLKAHRHTVVDEFLETSPMHILADTKLSVGRSVFGNPKIFQWHLLLYPTVLIISLGLVLLKCVLQQFPAWLFSACAFQEDILILEWHLCSSLDHQPWKVSVELDCCLLLPVSCFKTWHQALSVFLGE